jgi:hypothetical protein
VITEVSLRLSLKNNRRELASLRVCRDFEDVHLWKVLYNHAVRIGVSSYPTMEMRRSLTESLYIY